MSDNESYSYAKAGVDIAAGNALVRAIAPLAKATRRPGADAELGGFGGFFDLKAAGYDDPLLVAANDGVGTKLKLAIDHGRHDGVGIDLVAMCANDLIVQVAEPLFFLDYYVTGRLESGVAERVIAGIAEGCRIAGCALIGGETAEMPGMYGGGEYDVAGFAVGAVEREAMLPKMNAMQEGDVLLGLGSSGLHSNGYSLLRKLVETEGLDWDGPCPADHQRTLIDMCLEPTRIYVKPLLAVCSKLKGMAHITGGGLTENIPRVLPAQLAAEIDKGSWEMPALFEWMLRTGRIDAAEAYRSFNMGIGMALIVSEAEAEAVTASLTAAGEAVFRIGQLVSRDGNAVCYI